MVNKDEIAKQFYDIAELMEILDKNKFKVRAYKNAARNISSSDLDIMKLYENDDLKSIDGVGDSTAEKIKQYIEDGKIDYLEEIKKEVPDGLKDIFDLNGVGRKTAMKLYNKKGISNLDELEEACQNGELRHMDGFGQKTEQNILDSIEYKRKFSGRYRIDVAKNYSKQLVDYLKPHVDKIKVVGSLRRYKETIGDIDILTTGDADKIMYNVRNYPKMEKVLVSGDTKTSIMMDNGLQLDVRVVDENSWGAAIQYFTGSKQHNIKVRKEAQNKGWTLNEYRLKDEDNDEWIAGKNEKNIYESIGFDYIPPQLREDIGEHKMALNGKLPKLVEQSDIKGDLHLHTPYSDGNESINELVKKAQSLGYEYIGLADHVRSFGDSMTIEKWQDRKEQIESIDSNIKIFDAAEIDILTDGSLYNEEIPEELDFTIGAIHQKIDDDNWYERLENAFSTGLIDIIAHPTGREIGQREGNTHFDVRKFGDLCRDHNIIIEINSLPQRLDLRAKHIRQLDGVKYHIGTDSHGIGMMDYIEFGIGTAKKGMLEKEQIVNTHPNSPLQ